MTDLWDYAESDPPRKWRWSRRKAKRAQPDTPVKPPVNDVPTFPNAAVRDPDDPAGLQKGERVWVKSTGRTGTIGGFDGFHPNNAMVIYDMDPPDTRDGWDWVHIHDLERLTDWFQVRLAADTVQERLTIVERLQERVGLVDALRPLTDLYDGTLTGPEILRKATAEIRQARNRDEALADLIAWRRDPRATGDQPATQSDQEHP